MNKKLKPDGSYSSDAYGMINGYTELGSARKRRLMLDSRAILREVARHLAGMGLHGHALSYNRGGVAVSGDISAEFWPASDPLKRIYITIGASCVSCGRKDGLSIMARTHRYEKVERRRKLLQFWPGSPRMGANQWLSPAMDSLQIAESLRRIFANNYREVQFHTLSSTPIASHMTYSTHEELSRCIDSKCKIERALEQDMGQPIR